MNASVQGLRDLTRTSLEYRNYFSLQGYLSASFLPHSLLYYHHFSLPSSFAFLRCLFTVKDGNILQDIFIIVILVILMCVHFPAFFVRFLGVLVLFRRLENILYFSKEWNRIYCIWFQNHHAQYSRKNYIINLNCIFTNQT